MSKCLKTTSTKIHPMAENNFKQLEREQAERFRANTARVNKNIKANLGAFGFVGDLVDLYVTRAIGYLANINNKDIKSEDDHPSKYPNV